MSTFKPFRCSECGDRVALVKGPGRTSEALRGVSLPIPDDFAIPTCPTCGETYFSEQRSAALQRLQQPRLDAWKVEHVCRLVGLIRGAHGVRLRQIESVCGVTGTYLSHVMKGRRKPSVTLFRLLEAYALEPQEFARQLHAKPWEEAAMERQRETAEALIHGAASPPSFSRRLSWASPPDHAATRPANDTIAA